MIRCIICQAFNLTVGVIIMQTFARSYADAEFTQQVAA